MTLDFDDPAELRALGVSFLERASVIEAAHLNALHPAEHQCAVQAAQLTGADPVRFLGSRDRSSRITFARHVFWFLIRQRHDYSFPIIARMGVGWNHASVIHGVKSIQQRMAANPDFARRIATLQRNLGHTENGKKIIA